MSEEEVDAVEHAVIIHFAYGSTDLDALFALEDQLEDVLDETGVGELDGNEVAVDGSDGRLYLYGPDADQLFAAIQATLSAATFMRGAKVQLRYGPPEEGVDEKVVELV